MKKHLINYSSPYEFFQLQDYFPQQRDRYSSHTSENLLSFRYSTFPWDYSSFSKVIIYRANIHYYKVSVNVQDQSTKDTILHGLAKYNHYELIQFTLLHSHYKPNIYIVNNHGETFLHILIFNAEQWCADSDDRSQRISGQKGLFEINPDFLQINNNNIRNQNQHEDDDEDDDEDESFIVTDEEVAERYANFELVLDCIIDLILADFIS